MALEIALGNMTSWLVFIGIAIGQAGRTLIPYWDKLKSGEIDMFDKKFVGTAIIAFVGAVIPSLALFPTVMEQLDPSIANVGLAATFVLAILIGYGANDIVNYGLKLSTKSASNAALEKRIDVIVEEKLQARLNVISPTSTPTSPSGGTEQQQKGGIVGGEDVVQPGS